MPTTPDSLFSLPTELLATLAASFPCRGPQIRTLATLVHPRAAPVRNLIVHGVEATGKSAVTARLLAALHADDDPASASASASSALDYAVVRSAECVTARHLFERTLAAVADAVAGAPPPAAARCETLAALAVELGRLLERYGRSDRDDGRQDGEDAPAVVPDIRRRFVLVFDGIDRQREAPPTLLPALARLSEIVRLTTHTHTHTCPLQIPNLTTILIVTSPPTASLRLPGPPATLHFPAYTKAEYVAILSSIGPPAARSQLPNSTAQETADLWARFAGATHDALIQGGGGGGLAALRRACDALWPRFTAPVAAGTYRAREFTRLLVAARVLFQDESVLVPGVLGAASSNTPSATASAATAKTSTTMTTTAKPSKGMGKGLGAGADLAALLPLTPRLLLLAAYLASHNAPRHDQTLFSTWHHGARRRRGGRRGRRGGPNKTAAASSSSAATTPNRGRAYHARGSGGHRRIARKLLGPGAFVLERMVAIYAATRREWVGTTTVTTKPDGDGDGDTDEEGGGDALSVDADVAMALATLASLRLLVRVGGAGAAGGGASGANGGGWGGGADLDRGGKWRVNVSWEVIRALGRGMGVEVEEWLID